MSLGVVYKGRTEGMNPYMERFATKTDCRTLAEAMEDADVFVGLSVGNVVTPEMLKTMAPNPVIFALANPDPEIAYEAAVEARPDAIIATGRSDCPNQVNNVLGFPFIFRGALDVRATGHQRADEAGRHAGAGGAGQGGRAGFRAARLRRGSNRIRTPLHHSEAFRPARADLGGPGGGAGGDGQRRGTAAGEPRRVSGAVAPPSGQSARGHARHGQQGAARAEAGGLPRGRSEQDPACLPDPDRRADRQAHSARRRGAHLGQNLRPAPAPGRRGRRRSGAHAGAGGLCRGVLPTAPPQGSDAQRGRRADLEPQRVRRSHGAHGRRGRADQRAHRTLSGYAPAGAASAGGAAGAAPGQRSVRADHAARAACSSWPTPR